MPDQARRVPGGAAAQPALLEQNDIGFAKLRQVVCHGAADNATADEVATLEAGQNVIVCDSGAEGWSGIVFDPVDKQNPTCGTGSPVAEEQEYKGICTSGWIQSENLEMIAG